MIFYGHPHLMYGAHFYLPLGCQGFRDLEQPHLTAPASILAYLHPRLLPICFDKAA